MQYYGTRLSENISRREPEGYLLCLNVPVARTGVQEYLPEEGCITGYTDNYLKVYVQTDPEGAENCLNSIFPVRITDTFLDAAVGVLL